jgi:hypothetical protein
LIGVIVEAARYRFGPSRTYVGRFVNDDEVLEVRCSNGHVECLEPNPLSPYGPVFKWDYNGSGSNQTSAAILAHALGEMPGPREKYSDRVMSLVIPFTSAFIGDAQHEEVQNGFEIPGEVVLLWVLKNEARLLHEIRTSPDSYTAADAVELIRTRPRNFVYGYPDTLEDLVSERQPVARW